SRNRRRRPPLRGAPRSTPPDRPAGRAAGSPAPRPPRSGSSRAPEGPREIAPAAVAENRRDRRAGTRLAPDAQRRGDVRARRRADEETFLAREAPAHRVSLFRRDREPPVGERRVPDQGND